MPLDTASVPRPALWLGLSGLIPFLGLAVLSLALGGHRGDLAAAALAYYGVAILAFMGGCRWGFAAAGLGGGASLRLLGLSVLPALWAWGAILLVPAPFDLVALAVGFVALYAADLRLTAEGGAPAWWPALRLPLTGGAVVSLIVASFA